MKTWQKICIGIAITCTGLAVLGFWSRAELWHSLYPIAPPMPVVVSETMPEILGRLETILKTNAPQVLESLQPGLSAAAISRLEQQYQVQLPEDIRTIYEWHDGVRQGASNAGYDFIPIHRFVPLEEALEDNAARGKSGGSPWQYLAGQFIIGYQDTWFCLFFDDERNGYWFDPKRKPAEGAVFYNFMEDGSYIFFPSAKNLMAGIAECYEQGIFRVKPGSSPPQLDEDLDRSTKVWEELGASNQQ